jgi:hypothetical protein
MSFPVLQRMDRKRPEMIQPISWQAEAMKGLASGVQAGLQMAQTVNQIQLQRAANARDEATTALQNKFIGEQTTSLRIRNKKDKAEQDFQNVLFGQSMNSNMAYLNNVQNGLMFSYTSGLTRVEQNMNYAPSSIGEGLQSGYFANKVQPLATSALSNAAGPGSAADKLNGLEEVRSMMEPHGSGISMATKTFPDNPASKLLASLHPEVYSSAMSSVPVTVTVNESNANQLNPFVRESASKEGISLDAFIVSKRPVNIPFGTAIGGLRSGYYVDDFARMTAESANPEKFMGLLKKNGVNKDMLAQVQAGYDKIVGKQVVAVKADLVPPEGTTPLVETITKTINGVKVTQPASGIGDIDWFGLASESAANKIYAEFNPKAASAQSSKDPIQRWMTRKLLPWATKIEGMVSDPDKMSARVAETHSEKNKLSLEQKAIADQYKNTPTSELKKKSDALTKVIGWLQEDEDNLAAAGFAVAPDDGMPIVQSAPNSSVQPNAVVAEGTVIVNKQTNKRLIRRNSKWESYE